MCGLHERKYTFMLNKVSCMTVSGSFRRQTKGAFKYICARALEHTFLDSF